ncbi:16S rRNA (guanine527-N7)-methyltransferase [Fibrobacter sp. UWCM]|uniref:16S rRNA (guanine(527)-N(7))-methyltransferase RsmG n=1 Tax=Fibrobacter sp. UWCM TaxID=1896208 RepID=UPI0009199EF3|nr:RsmG family class I SAM-dependent methyltransferase [Fibrobacter sp. UWCM]SHH25005.1 16S rRNA (guanine527-N7)-methyltransferase [Fibrobacter sp. UWCM]
MSYRTNIEQQNLLNQFLKEHILSELSKEQMDKLYDFADLVVETKQFGNLISAKDSEKFLSRHIADSLIPYIYIVKELDIAIESMDPIGNSVSSRMTIGKKWADMGAGAGCPVFPLAIAMPEVQFYAVEPRHMRVEFMNYAKEKLGLKNLTVVGKRFETSGLANLDFISCRALSTFENDWERAQPALKKGGLFLTLKSFNSISHLENDPAVNIWKYKLPNEEQDYALVTRGNK